MASKQIFRVIFHNHEQCYEVYAQKVYQSDMHGFIVIENMLFGEKSRIVVDPSEEKLKSEFQDVQRTFVPMHQIVRIDQVDKQGTAKIWDAHANRSKVTTLHSSQGGQKSST